MLNTAAIYGGAWLKSRVINLSQAVVEWRIKVLQVRSGNPSFGIYDIRKGLDIQSGQ